MKVGDLVKERRGEGGGIVIEVHTEMNAGFGAEFDEYIQVGVLYPSGKIFRQSTHAFEVISESR